VDTFPDATVLVVDDTAENLAAVGCFLEGLCSTAAALSGAEALELAFKLQPDVILLDVLMPGMSGLDVLKELQAHPVTKSIAVLLVTSLNDPESKLEGFAHGAVDFVTKPFLAGELRARVATQLRIRQLEHELRQQIRSLNVEISEGRQNFDFLAQHINSCLLCLDAWDRVVLINPGWHSLTGKDPDEALGQLFYHLFLPADQQIVRQKISQALAARHVHVNFLARLTPQGNSKTVLVSASFPRGLQTGNYRWCAILTDVSQLAADKEKWKSAHEHLQGHYAACWEELNQHCRPLEKLLADVEPKAEHQSKQTLPNNATDLHLCPEELEELLATTRKLLHFVCKNELPVLSHPSTDMEVILDSPIKQPPTTSFSCLLVEPSPVRSRLFSILLSDCGISSIRMASTLADANNQIQEGPPDFLLIDLSMVHEEGAPHPAEFLRTSGSSGTKVIGVVSPGFTSPPKDLEKLCDCILYKPLSLSSLRSALEELEGSELSAEKIR